MHAAALADTAPGVQVSQGRQGQQKQIAVQGGVLGFVEAVWSQGLFLVLLLFWVLHER